MDVEVMRLLLEFLTAIAVSVVLPVLIAWIGKRQDKKLDAIAEVGVKTEMLCNSAMGRALKMTAVTARSKADVTHDSMDIVAAELAERMLGEHEARQSRADAKE